MTVDKTVNYFVEQKKELFTELKKLSTVDLSRLWFKIHKEKLLEKRQYLLNYLIESPRISKDSLKEFYPKTPKIDSDTKSLKVGNFYFIKMTTNEGFAKIRRIDGNYSEIEWLTESIAEKKMIEYAIPNGCIYDLKSTLLNKVISFRTSYAPFEVKNQIVVGVKDDCILLDLRDGISGMPRAVNIGKVLTISKNDAT
jgi:hypothetical protein